MMGQHHEELQNRAVAAGFTAPEGSIPKQHGASVYIYGYGPTKNPFYEEAKALNATPEGALLILATAVDCGQKVLLINGARSNPVEAEILSTRTLGAQIFEAEVAFSVPRPDFWKPLREEGTTKALAERRRFPRVNLPRGMTVSWQASERRDISRVASLSLGGMFIETPAPARVGDSIQVQFHIPGGSVQARAIVRRRTAEKGMGIEFTDMPAAARSRLEDLIKKLLGEVRS